MIKKMIEATVRALGELECEAIMSTGSIDREGDVISPSGWRTDQYMRNPVVLLSHDHKSLPVAKVTSITKTANGLRARISFPPPGISPRADEARGLLKSGFLNSVSVGFVPLKSSPSRTRFGGGTDFEEQELLELSFVSVPANADAVITMRGVGRKPECPRGQLCSYDVKDGRCQAPDDNCPLFAGVPSKDLERALNDVRPELVREAQEQLRVAMAAQRTPPTVTRGINLFEGNNLAPTALQTLSSVLGLSEEECANAVIDGLKDLQRSGELGRIVKREVMNANRALWGR